MQFPWIMLSADLEVVHEVEIVNTPSEVVTTMSLAITLGITASALPSIR